MVAFEKISKDLTRVYVIIRIIIYLKGSNIGELILIMKLKISKVERFSNRVLCKFAIVTLRVRQEMFLSKFLKKSIFTL